jgi:hypothetical protein
MRRLLPATLVLLLLLSHVCAGEQIAFIRMGDKDPAVWNSVKRYMSGMGYGITFYDGAMNLDGQVETANRINRSGAALTIALDLTIGEKETVFVGISSAKKGKGSILALDEVPAVHEALSREAAGQVASVMGVKVREIPLFPLLGLDMPAFFLRLGCPKAAVEERFDALHRGLESYYKRGVKNEK